MLSKEEKRIRHRIASKKHYLKNIDKKRKYKKEYDIKNKEKIIEYGKELRSRPEYQERIKKWRKENKEHLVEKAKEWREENKEYKKKKDKEYQQNNRDKINKYHRDYRKEKTDKVNSWYKKYNNSEKGRINWTKQNHLRLSKKYGNEFKLTQEEIRKIFERDKVCVYCGSDNRLELDHIISISKGGKSIFENFVIACRHCNPSKSNKDVYEWCMNQGIGVPKIVKELLSKQNQGIGIVA